MTVGFSSANVLNKWLDVIRSGGSNFTAITNAYVKLHTGDPGAAGASNAAAGSTTRVVVAQTLGTNTMTITGTNPAWTNGGTSETITHISVWDASSAGNFLYSVQLTASKAWASGDTLTLNSLTVSLSPAAA